MFGMATGASIVSPQSRRRNLARRCSQGIGIVVLLALFWLGLVPGRPVQATGADPARSVAADVGLGVDCDAGACSVRLGVGGADGPALTWRVAESNLTLLPAGGLELRNAATLQSPWGEMRLADLQLRLAVDAHSQLTGAHGSAVVEFPRIGEFALLRSVLPLHTTIGFGPLPDMPQLASTFAGTVAGLDAPPAYLYFDVVAGQRLGAHTPTQGVDEAGLAVAPGQQARVVLDPESGVLWADGELMLYSYGQGALIEQLLTGDLASVEWSLDALPLRQVLVLSATGMSDAMAGNAPAQMLGETGPFLRTAAEYMVDAGAVGEWLRLGDSRLVIGGGVDVSAQGTALAGHVAAALFPASLLDAQAQARLTLPSSDAGLDEERAGELVVVLGADLPVLGVSGDLAAAISSRLQVDAALTLAHTWGGAPMVYSRQGSTSPAQLWQVAQAGWERIPWDSATFEHAVWENMAWQNMTGAVTSGYNEVSSNMTGQAVAQQALAQWTRLENGLGSLPAARSFVPGVRIAWLNGE
ncbi:MAG: hypothetical protein WDZ49_14695 [Litorilinea sp.]